MTCCPALGGVLVERLGRSFIQLFQNPDYYLTSLVHRMFHVEGTPNIGSFTSICGSTPNLRLYISRQFLFMNQRRFELLTSDLRSRLPCFGYFGSCST